MKLNGIYTQSWLKNINFIQERSKNVVKKTFKFIFKGSWKNTESM